MYLNSHGSFLSLLFFSSERSFWVLYLDLKNIQKQVPLAPSFSYCYTKLYSSKIILLNNILNDHEKMYLLLYIYVGLDCYLNQFQIGNNIRWYNRLLFIYYPLTNSVGSIAPYKSPNISTIKPLIYNHKILQHNYPKIKPI